MAGTARWPRDAAKIGLNLGTVPAGSTVRIAVRRGGCGRRGRCVDVAVLGDLLHPGDRRSEAGERVGSGQPGRADPPDRRGAGSGSRRPALLRGLAPGSLSVRRAGRRRARCGSSASTRATCRPTPRSPLVEGTYDKGHGLLSVEAARALRVGVGDVVQPPCARPRPPRSRVPISGITDLSRARSLFYSRQGQQLEQFVYVPNSLVVGPRSSARRSCPPSRSRPPPRGTMLRSQPITRGGHPPRPRPPRRRSWHRAGSRPGRSPRPSTPSPRARTTSSTTSPTRCRWPAPMPTPPSACSCSWGCPGRCWRPSSPRTREGCWPVPSGGSRPSSGSGVPTGAGCSGCTPCAPPLLAAVGSVLGVGLGLVSAIAVLPADALARASGLSVGLSALLGAGVRVRGRQVAPSTWPGAERSTGEISDERAQLASRPPLVAPPLAGRDASARGRRRRVARPTERRSGGRRPGRCTTAGRCRCGCCR